MPLLLAILLLAAADLVAQAPRSKRIESVDSARVDTASPRLRRQRTPRPPRPGVFSSLDSARTMPDSVIVLSLRGKGLTTVTGLGSFKNLQVLDLSDNALTTFPVEVLRLSKLLTLDLSGNPIKTVPEEIGSLTQMTRLNLRSTSITMLPAGIGKCVSLSSLDVSKNALVSLPIKELNRLPLLRSVLIGGIQQGEPSAEPTEASPQQPDAGK